MRKNSMIAILAAATLSAAANEKVTYNQLPEAVRQTVNTSKGSDTIKDIQKQVNDGKVVYEVEFERRGLNSKLWVADDGSVVRDNRKEGTIADRGVVSTDPAYSPPLARVPSMKVSELPEPVQTTIRQQAAGREVADVDKETWNGKTVYEVEFAQAGRNAQIHIAEDGTVVKDEQTRTGTGTGLFGRFMGTQLEETPLPVQETIKREAQGRKIADIDKEMRTGEPVYEVEIQQPGQNFELHVAQNGSILRDSRKPDAFGAPARQPQTGTERANAGARNLSLTDLPVAVQDRIKATADPAQLKGIQINRKMRDGKVFYEVEFEKEGRNTKQTIAEDGTLLDSNRP